MERTASDDGRCCGCGRHGNFHRCGTWRRSRDTGESDLRDFHFRQGISGQLPHPDLLKVPPERGQIRYDIGKLDVAVFRWVPLLLLSGGFLFFVKPIGTCRGAFVDDVTDKGDEKKRDPQEEKERRFDHVSNCYKRENRTYNNFLRDRLRLLESGLLSAGRHTGVFISFPDSSNKAQTGYKRKKVTIGYTQVFPGCAGNRDNNWQYRRRSPDVPASRYCPFAPPERGHWLFCRWQPSV